MYFHSLPEWKEMFCQILSCENVNGWNYTQKDVFLFIVSFSSSWKKENSFADLRALEMFVAIFLGTVNLIICTSSSKLICRCRDWNLWQEVEDSSGFNTVHSWIEINPEQLHLSVIVASELSYCNTFSLQCGFSPFIFITTYLSRIRQLETIKKGIED